MGVLFRISISLNNLNPHYMTSSPTRVEEPLLLFILITFYDELNSSVYVYAELLHVYTLNEKY